MGQIVVFIYIFYYIIFKDIILVFAKSTFVKCKEIT